MNNSQYPPCQNKKQGHLVCLHPECSIYPFFCTTCDSEQCEAKHFHGDRLNSISFKELIKRILKERKPSDELENGLKRYEECLVKFRKDVEEFVEKEMKQIEEIRRKATELPEKEEALIKKIRKKQYNGIEGKQLDDLWRNISALNSQKKEAQTLQFLELKEEEIKQISSTFQTLNSMSLENENQKPAPQGEKKEKNEEKQEKKQEKQEKKEDDLDDIKVNDVDDRMQ